MGCSHSRALPAHVAPRSLIRVPPSSGESEHGFVAGSNITPASPLAVVAAELPAAIETQVAADAAPAEPPAPAVPTTVLPHIVNVELLQPPLPDVAAAPAPRSASPPRQEPQHENAPLRRPSLRLAPPAAVKVDVPALPPVLPLSTPRSGRDVVEVTSARKVKDTATGQKRINQYLMLEVLGKGSYGKVRRCIDETTGEVRAVKIMKKSFLKRKRIGRFGNALQNVQREIAVWKKLDHPNVVVLFEVIDDASSDKLYLISEFVDGGCLMKDERAGEPLPLPLVRHYTQQLLSAVAYLHFMRVVHRDIKPGNLLLSKDHVLKVGDFGVSQVFEAAGSDALRSTAGTAAFQAPEMLSGGSFSGMKADMWACGMTLFMCVHGRPAFMAPTLPEMYALIVGQPVVWEKDSALTDDAESLGLAKDLAMALLNKDAEARLTADAALRHPFLHCLPPPIPNPAARIIVNDSEIRGAIDVARPMRAVLRAASAGKASLSRARMRILLKSGSAASFPNSEGATGNSSPLSSNTFRREEFNSPEAAVSPSGAAPPAAAYCSSDDEPGDDSLAGYVVLEAAAVGHTTSGGAAEASAAGESARVCRLSIASVGSAASVFSDSADAGIGRDVDSTALPLARDRDGNAAASASLLDATPRRGESFSA